jgi:cell division septum initiation protein DivIVA
VEVLFAMSESLPSDVYQSMGDEIGDLLQQAHDWAERARAEAQSEADRVTEQAAAAAKRVVAEADTRAERLRSESEATAERLRLESEATAEKLRSESEERATRLLSEAEERAERLRSDSEAAATKLRANAETHAQRVRTDADVSAQRSLKEANTRVAELRAIESETRQRIDVLTKRLVSIAEQLSAEATASGDFEEPTDPENADADQPQQEEPGNDLQVEVVHEDEDESIGEESGQFATEGTKA